jgi:hypothetical protein
MSPESDEHSHYPSLNHQVSPTNFLCPEELYLLGNSAMQSVESQPMEEASRALLDTCFALVSCLASSVSKIEGTRQLTFNRIHSVIPLKSEVIITTAVTT